MDIREAQEEYFRAERALDRAKEHLSYCNRHLDEVVYPAVELSRGWEEREHANRVKNSALSDRRHAEAMVARAQQRLEQAEAQLDEARSADPFLRLLEGDE